MVLALTLHPPVHPHHSEAGYWIIPSRFSLRRGPRSARNPHELRSPHNRSGRPIKTELAEQHAFRGGAPPTRPNFCTQTPSNIHPRTIEDVHACDGSARWHSTHNDISIHRPLSRHLACRKRLQNRNAWRHFGKHFHFALKTGHTLIGRRRPRRYSFASSVSKTPGPSSAPSSKPTSSVR